MSITGIQQAHRKFHYKRKLVLLQRGTDPGKQLFLIHDGTGRIEGYLPFCSCADPRFQIYGIVPVAAVDGIPRNLSIEQLAAGYADTIVQHAAGPYYIAGWSIGGTLALEICRQLAAKGLSAPLCWMFDTPHPGYYPQASTAPFTPKNEAAFFSRFIHSGRLLEQLLASSSMEQFYGLLLDSGGTGLHWESFFEAMEEEWPFPLQQSGAVLTMEERLYHLNVNRVLHHARTQYTPHEPADTFVHLFKALEEPIEDLESWASYCRDLTVYPVQASHYSIFMEEYPRTEIASTFNAILEKEYPYDRIIDGRV